MWPIARLTLPTWLLVVVAAQRLDVRSPDDEYCPRHGPLSDTLTTNEAVELVDAAVLPPLQQLLKLDFFRYFKTDLYKDCPFWVEPGICSNPGCSVETVANDERLRQMWHDENLGALESSSLLQDSPFRKKCDFTDKDFCLVEDDSSDNGAYIDLLKNPERFTGYAGPSAQRVWQAIYEQNCFEFVFGDQRSMLDTFQDLRHPVEDSCIERRAFYRVISGLHTSISTHLCDQWLNKTTGNWGPNLECFDQRVGQFPKRLDNMYFLYSMLLQAVAKVQPLLESYTFCTGDKMENLRSQALIREIVTVLEKNGPFFNEAAMFANGGELLKEDFKMHFRNISRIMDCVGCEKCRLWGKIQVSGIGTALKILFSYTGKEKGHANSAMRLRRSELVSLFNALGRITESVRSVEKFRRLHRASRTAAATHWLRAHAERLLPRQLVAVMVHVDVWLSRIGIETPSGVLLLVITVTIAIVIAKLTRRILGK